MRYMGLDYGSRTIGVAISDPFAMFSQSLEVIRRKPEDGLKASMNRISLLVNEYGVEAFVLGMPLKMNQQIGEWGEQVLLFKKRLEGTFNLPVYLCDERRSSVIADSIMLEADVSRSKRKDKIDKLAAAVILQRYLDTPERLRNVEIVL